MASRWTDEQIALLREHYPSIKSGDLAGLIGRPASCVRRMAVYLCIKKVPGFMSDINKGRERSAGFTSAMFPAIHGAAGKADPTYKVWKSMRQRCNYPKHKSYADYGGRGIRVCERWDSFVAFREDMGTKPAGMTLERIDNSGDYEPSNCRWATLNEQARNRRSTKFIDAFGERRPLVEWAEKYAIRADTLAYRLKHGWSAERALVTPVGGLAEAGHKFLAPGERIDRKTGSDGLLRLRVVRG